MSNLLKKEKGFTLIEIVLVLAIAGLLMVIVFLAVSGAQKSRRDTQRKNDLGRIYGQIESFASNNNGYYPGMQGTQTTWDVFKTSTYVTGLNLNDPTSGTGYLQINDPNTPGYVTYTIGSSTGCDGTTQLGARQYKVEMKLEQGTACRDNR